MEFNCICYSQISGRTLYDEQIDFLNLCLSYPLIIFESDNCVYFFGEEVVLEKKEILLLKEIVEHNTKKLKTGKPRGITPKTLCKRIGVKSRNVLDDEYFDRRLTKHKSDIFAKIKSAFKTSENKYKTVIDKNEYEHILYKGQYVDENSPYYSFDLMYALNRLFYSSKTKTGKKYFTDFSYSFMSAKEIDFLKKLL